MYGKNFFEIYDTITTAINETVLFMSNNGVTNEMSDVLKHLYKSRQELTIMCKGVKEKTLPKVKDGQLEFRF